MIFTIQIEFNKILIIKNYFKNLTIMMTYKLEFYAIKKCKYHNKYNNKN